MAGVVRYVNGLVPGAPDLFGAAIGSACAQLADESLSRSSVVEYGWQLEIAERHLSQVGESAQMVEVYEIG